MVVRFFYLVVLPRDNFAYWRGKAVIHRLLVLFYCGIFATFAFRQDGMIAALSQSRFQVDPAAVQRTGSAATRFRISLAQVVSVTLQLRRET